MAPDSHGATERERRDGHSRWQPDTMCLLGVLIVMATIALTPRSWWPVAAGWPFSWLHVVAALVSATAIVTTRVPPATLLRRWFAFAPLVVLPAASLGLASGLTPAAGRNFLCATAKGYLGFTLVLTLLHGLGWRRLLAALGRLGVPELLLSTVAFMERYRTVLADELLRARRARLARTYHAGWLVRWRQAGSLLGTTLLRSIERAQRVHSAMLARGFGSRPGFEP